MSFINLSSRFINKLHIVEIVKQPSKYYIYMSDSRIDGIMMFSFGDIRTKHNFLEICETQNPQDYKKITDFIERF